MKRMWWVAAVVLVGLALGGLWPPHDIDRVALTNRHAAPSLVHPLGTDHLGRDVLSRLLLGGWRTLLVLVYVCAVMLGLGVPVGLISALAGPTGEAALMRLTDFCLIVPPLVLALAVSALCGLSPVTAGLALGLGSWGHYAVFVQSLAKSVLAEPYVLAAHALGLTPAQIATRHVAPNVLPLVLVYRPAMWDATSCSTRLWPSSAWVPRRHAPIGGPCCSNTAALCLSMRPCSCGRASPLFSRC